MEKFLKEVVEANKFELLIDTNLFPKDIVLKSAYNFLDRGYFFFKLDSDGNILLQFTKKEENNEKPETIIWDFSDELLSVYLRDKLENDNKNIREIIVWSAIKNSLDPSNFVEIDTEKQALLEENTVNFDKDIDEILEEIENDPELKIDEEEIDKMLKEVENESNQDNSIRVDPEAVKKAKENFKK